MVPSVLPHHGANGAIPVTLVAAVRYVFTLQIDREPFV